MEAQSGFFLRLGMGARREDHQVCYYLRSNSLGLEDIAGQNAIQIVSEGHVILRSVAPHRRIRSRSPLHQSVVLRSVVPDRRLHNSRPEVTLRSRNSPPRVRLRSVSPPPLMDEEDHWYDDDESCGQWSGR